MGCYLVLRRVVHAGSRRIRGQDAFVCAPGRCRGGGDSHNHAPRQGRRTVCACPGESSGRLTALTRLQAIGAQAGLTAPEFLSMRDEGGTDAGFDASPLQASMMPTEPGIDLAAHCLRHDVFAVTDLLSLSRDRKHSRCRGAAWPDRP